MSFGLSRTQLGPVTLNVVDLLELKYDGLHTHGVLNDIGLLEGPELDAVRAVLPSPIRAARQVICLRICTPGGEWDFYYSQDAAHPDPSDWHIRKLN